MDHRAVDNRAVDNGVIDNGVMDNRAGHTTGTAHTTGLTTGMDRSAEVPRYEEASELRGKHHDMEKGAEYDTAGGYANTNEAMRYDNVNEAAPLKRELKGRHMQMIAIGGSIGAGLFVGAGGALQTGGPGSLTLGFIIVGFMLLFMMQALGELAVLYPVNGAFFQYMCRFMDPAWGFAIGWDYAISWLTVLPFELTAAGITIAFWRPDLNIGIWITVFFIALTIIQIFGVRGYGEVEFVLSIIKIIACCGFIILGIVIDLGGVGNQGHIGAHYWHDPGAFRNGFKGFCSVFVTAAFAFGGTELAGLAAAEARDPAKSLPRATKQVFWRIFFFYIVNTFILGLIVRSDNPHLLGSSGADTKASPFVIAIQNAGIKGLPSVFNAVITIAVLSVANSCTFGSTRTFQALAAYGMAPKSFAYVDKHGRPITTVILQLAFALLAFINEANVGNQVFNWLLALSGIQYFFTWGSICIAHIRFRRAWAYHGHSVDELPFRAAFGVVGSYIGATLNIVCLIAQFYIALWPIGGKPNAEAFFETYLTAPLIIGLYGFWKIYSAMSKNPKINHRGWKLYVRTSETDVLSGIREGCLYEPEEGRRLAEERRNRPISQKIMAIPKGLWGALIN